MVVSPPADRIDTFAIPFSVLSTLTVGQIDLALEPSFARNLSFSSSSCYVHQHNPNSFTSGALGGVLNFRVTLQFRRRPRKARGGSPHTIFRVLSCPRHTSPLQFPV